MKNIWKSLFVAALFVSCSESMTEEAAAPEVNNGKAIQFEVVNEGGRAAFFQGEGHGAAFEAGDQLGIRSWTGSETYDSTTRTRGNYTVNEDGTLTKTAYDDIVYGEDVTTYITAFYPATTNANANNIGNVTLPRAQTQAAANDHSHIDDYMILSTAKPYVFAADNHPASVSLSLQNVLSIVEVTLTGSEAVEVASLTMQTSSDAPLAFSVGKLDTTLNLDEKDTAITVTTGESSVALNLTTPAVLSAEGSKFYFVVLPGAHAKNDIVLSASTTDGKVYRVEMGAIEFKMNKVYRPVIEWSKFKEFKLAEIEHTFDNGDSSVVYGTPALLQENGLLMLNRAHFRYYNIPDCVKDLQVAAIEPKIYPTTNKIKATQPGWVYMLVGTESQANMQAANTFFEEKGWTAMSVVPESFSKTTKPADGRMYYQFTDQETSDETEATVEVEKYATMVVYGKEFVQDEEFDLTEYPVTNFQGIRPVAKKIINKHDKYLVLAFNFTLPVVNQNDADWIVRSSFSDVANNPYEGSKTYKFLNGVSYALDFTGTAGTKGMGCSMHDDGYLLMYLRYSTTGESIGFPAIDGYKLIKVGGNTTITTANSPYMVVSSVPARAEGAPIEVSNAVELTAEDYNTDWLHTLENPVAGTPYYLFGIDDTPGKSPAKDPRINALYATYEKVE